MIANPHVSHRLPWWSYLVLLAALAVLPCLPKISQAQQEDAVGGAAGNTLEDDLQDGVIARLPKDGASRTERKV